MAFINPIILYTIIIVLIIIVLTAVLIIIATKISKVKRKISVIEKDKISPYLKDFLKNKGGNASPEEKLTILNKTSKDFFKNMFSYSSEKTFDEIGEIAIENGEEEIEKFCNVMGTIRYTGNKISNSEVNKLFSNFEKIILTKKEELSPNAPKGFYEKKRDIYEIKKELVNIGKLPINELGKKPGEIKEKSIEKPEKKIIEKSNEKEMDLKEKLEEIKKEPIKIKEEHKKETITIEKEMLEKIIKEKLDVMMHKLKKERVEIKKEPEKITGKLTKIKEKEEIKEPSEIEEPNEIEESTENHGGVIEERLNKIMNGLKKEKVKIVEKPVKMSLPKPIFETRKRKIQRPIEKLKAKTIKKAVVKQVKPKKHIKKSKDPLEKTEMQITKEIMTLNQRIEKLLENESNVQMAEIRRNFI